MDSTSLIKPVDLQGLSLALAKTKADYEAKIDFLKERTLWVGFTNESGAGNAVVGTTTVGLENITTNYSFANISNAWANEKSIYFVYQDYIGQAFINNNGNSFSAICYNIDNSTETDGIKIIYKSDGTISSSRFYIPVPEDDENILNLLTEYGYSAPLSDIDGNVITDVDRNLILG